jgi:hypothetical protein
MFLSSGPAEPQCFSKQAVITRMLFRSAHFRVLISSRAKNNIFIYRSLYSNEPPGSFITSSILKHYFSPQHLLPLSISHRSKMTGRIRNMTGPHYLEQSQHRLSLSRKIWHIEVCWKSPGISRIRGSAEWRCCLGNRMWLHVKLASKRNFSPRIMEMMLTSIQAL